jgi:hypothetical protein
MRSTNRFGLGQPFCEAVVREEVTKRIGKWNLRGKQQNRYQNEKRDRPEIDLYGARGARYHEKLVVESITRVWSDSSRSV